MIVFDDGNLQGLLDSFIVNIWILQQAKQQVKTVKNVVVLPMHLRAAFNSYELVSIKPSIQS